MQTALPSTTPEGVDHKHDEAHGPTEGTYFSVFVALVVLTLLEVLSTYLPGIKFPILMGLMIAKVWLVVSYFMHLKYDRPILRYVFLAPVIIGILVAIFLAPLVQ